MNNRSSYDSWVNVIPDGYWNEALWAILITGILSLLALIILFILDNFTYSNLVPMWAIATTIVLLAVSFLSLITGSSMYQKAAKDKLVAAKHLDMIDDRIGLSEMKANNFYVNRDGKLLSCQVFEKPGDHNMLTVACYDANSIQEIK